MINEQIKNIYRSQLFVKIFLGGILVTLVSCILNWMNLEGFAMFTATGIMKFIRNLKTITIVAGIMSVLWLFSGMIIHEKNIRFVSVSSALLMVLFFYMAYSVFSKEIDNNDNIIGGIIILVCGLSYIIPILLSLKNNFKCLFMNINLTLFYLLFCLAYIIIKFSDSVIRAFGFKLQYGPYVAFFGVLAGLVSSIILTIKIQKDAHKKEIVAETINETTDI